jgi:hypothetical protein
MIVGSLSPKVRTRRSPPVVYGYPSVETFAAAERGRLDRRLHAGPTGPSDRARNAT